MKIRNVSLMFLVVLFAISALLYAESESTNKRTYIGFRLDPRPLPDLLLKHLGLSAGQGFRISNLHRNGPADEAGLERDDILIGFQGKDVTDYKEFVNSIRQESPGTEVTLEIIHLGKRQNVKVKLGLFEGQGEYNWKYPLEPAIIQLVRPRIFERSGEGGWIERPLDQIPRKVGLQVGGDLKDGTPELLKEAYSYSYSDGDQTYTITIGGNPNDEDTEVSVRIGDTEYPTTVKKMDELPKKYRAIAEGALQDARKSSEEADLEHQLYFRKSDTPSSPSYSPATQFAPAEEIFEKIEKQMIEMQQRLEKLEKLQEKVLEQLSDELKKAKSVEQENKQQKV